MFANERYDVITELIKAHRSVTVSELCERFCVSIETVRRDLAYLEKKKKLMRVHGGAVALSEKNVEFAALSVRVDDNVDKKRSLSETAMKFISEGDVIAIDAGSTAVEFTNVLCEHFSRLTVITYSSDVIEIASKREGYKVIGLGGTYLACEKMFHGYIAEETMRSLHADKCFIFPSALSLGFGATTNLEETVAIVKEIIRSSDKVYILADSSKFETNSPIRLLSLQEADAVVTDAELDASIAALYTENGIELIK